MSTLLDQSATRIDAAVEKQPADVSGSSCSQTVSQPQDADVALKAGADTFLEKPVPGRVLMEEMARLLAASLKTLAKSPKELDLRAERIRYVAERRFAFPPDESGTLNQEPLLGEIPSGRAGAIH
jgi:hypothetical protein